MIKKLALSALILTSSLFASSEVNVYSHRHYDTDKKLFKMFDMRRKNTISSDFKYVYFCCVVQAVSEQAASHRILSSSKKHVPNVGNV